MDALPFRLDSMRVVVLPTQAQRRVQLLLFALRTLRQDPFAQDELALAMLEDLCAGLGAVQCDARGGVQAVEGVRSLLAAHPETHLTLAEIARTVNLSPYHLARRFRKIVGMSIHQYRTQTRLGLAFERITSGSTDLAALAADLGFAGHSHFSLAFRTKYGFPPSQVLKMPTQKLSSAEGFHRLPAASRGAAGR
jgi:AraC-like DNA-binding protein